MHITDLAHVPHVAPTLAAWSYQTWQHFFPELSEAHLLAEFEASLASGGIPLTLVALDAGQPCGMASLVMEDGLPDYGHLSPWLASVYVVESHRRRGIGAQLVNGIVEVAQQRGIPTLYLWTDSEADWYAKLGWLVIASTRFREQAVTVMGYPLL